MMGKRIKIIVPIPMDAEGVANRAAQLPADFIMPGAEVEFVAVEWGDGLFSRQCNDDHANIFYHACRQGQYQAYVHGFYGRF